jgi:hypothetical protein
MSRARVLLVLPALLVLSPAPARAQDFNDQGVLSVSFYLRASLNDEALLCSDHDFRDRAEASNFAHVIAPKLGFGLGTFVFDTIDYKDCVRLFPDKGLTRPGPKPHERVFHFDPNPVVAAANKEFHLDLIGIDVCTPELPTRVSSAIQDRFGGSCDHPFQQTYSWFSSEDGSAPVIDVSFRATPASLLRALVGHAVFWALIAGLLGLLAYRLKRKQWRFFINHRFIAWTLNVILMIVLLFCVVFIVPYWTNWIPSLQMYIHIGVGGEAALVAIPAIGLLFTMIRAVGRLRAPQTPVPAAGAASGTEGIPQLGVPDWWDH